MPRDFKQYLSDVYFKDLGSLSVVMFFVYLLAGYGVIRASYADPTGDFSFMFRHLNPLAWACLFWLMAGWSVAKVLNKCFLQLVCIGMLCLGIWLWFLMFFSSGVFSNTVKMAPLYLVLVAIEFWRLAREIGDYMEKQQGAPESILDSEFGGLVKDDHDAASN